MPSLNASGRPYSLQAAGLGSGGKVTGGEGERITFGEQQPFPPLVRVQHDHDLAGVRRQPLGSPDGAAEVVGLAHQPCRVRQWGVGPEQAHRAEQEDQGRDGRQGGPASARRPPAPT
jgi:hypothetical protein